jgi:ubiquinone/menaquinone biosynthesis C-methylase UbiE
MTLSTQESRQDQWYARYYAVSGSDRNDLRANRGTHFQTLALEFSLIRALSAVELDFAASTLLDVGCGSAGNLYHYLRLGFGQHNITGIEIRAAQIAEARAAYPNTRFVHGDATRMHFESGAFDMVSESTMFVSLTSDSVRAAIASEMLRVCRPGGYVVLIDWRTPWPGNSHYKAVTMREVRRLFHLGVSADLVARRAGALIPPIGRAISRHAWPLYFLLSSLMPALVGQVVYVIRKRGEPERFVSLPAA